MAGVGLCGIRTPANDRPERVDGDQDDRTVDRRRGARIAPAADGGQARTEGGESQNKCETKRAGHGDLRESRARYLCSCSSAVLACAASGDVRIDCDDLRHGLHSRLLVALAHGDCTQLVASGLPQDASASAAFWYHFAGLLGVLFATLISREAVEHVPIQPFRASAARVKTCSAACASPFSSLVIARPMLARELSGSADRISSYAAAALS